MKSVFQLFCAVLLSSFIFISCSNDDDDDNYNFPSEITNTIEYDGESYKIKRVEQTYYGEEKGYSCFDLDFTCEDGLYLWSEILLPKNNTRLVSGTYSYSKDPANFALNAFLDIPESEYDLELTGGIKLEVSGNNFTIYIDCKTKGGKSVRGSYKGNVSYYEESYN